MRHDLRRRVGQSMVECHPASVVGGLKAALNDTWSVDILSRNVNHILRGLLWHRVTGAFEWILESRRARRPSPLIVDPSTWSADILSRNVNHFFLTVLFNTRSVSPRGARASSLPPPFPTRVRVIPRVISWHYSTRLTEKRLGGRGRGGSSGTWHAIAFDRRSVTPHWSFCLN